MHDPSRRVPVPYGSPKETNCRECQNEWARKKYAKVREKHKRWQVEPKPLPAGVGLMLARTPWRAL
jgi:hypothetical protein